MDSDSLPQILGIILLLFFSAFFSSAETALTTANKVRLKTLAEEGNRRAKRALKVQAEYGKMLSTILIGNNIVNIAATALATVLASKISIPVGLVTGILTVIVLMFCEILPKNISMAKANTLAPLYGGVIFVLMKLFTPFIFIFDGISKAFMKLFGIDTSAKDMMTESEFLTYVDVSHEDGVIEDDEKEIIMNVFDFGDHVAKDIMIPRVNIEMLSINATLQETLDTFRTHMYTRLPVYDGDRENVVGLINIKDMINIREAEDFSVEKLMYEGYYTYEYKKTAELLNEMRSERANVAFVLNEYGTLEGMITLEDLLEEIVGEIRDEYDADEENLIQKMEENTWLIEASMKLDDINDELGTDLSSEDYDTIGGLVIEYLEDRIPEDGETITTKEGAVLRVSGIVKNRIEKVILTLPEKEEEEEKN
ncbi:MAG: hemolysin family protein [Lachnospiraceae bacterium]|nr:hemolysin family protein [Lachnospiraceae bacterium]